MKTGILTFHRSRNYGAVLQAYALCSVLNSMGANAEIIDYRCEKLEDSLKLWEPQISIGKSVMRLLFRYKKKRAFDLFDKEYLLKSRDAYVKDSFAVKSKEYYDTIIVGSDQVWNYHITGNDSVYLLQGTECRKVSYAASTGDNVELSSEMITDIACFDGVSVREAKLRDYLKANGIESCVCCDPTILAGQECFESITAPRLINQKYVFVFMIWKSETLMRNAECYAKANGFKVVNNKDSVEFFLHCSPVEFLSWMKNAEAVFTNSFHGTVFSILFKKSFVSSLHRVDGKQNLRIKELLSCLECCENMIYDETIQVKSIKLPDYESVFERIKGIQNESKAFLQAALKIQ